MRINADIYCSGAPNYFIFAVSNAYNSKGDTYSLINNNVWCKSSQDLTEHELEVYTRLGTELIHVNQ